MFYLSFIYTSDNQYIRQYIGENTKKLVSIVHSCRQKMKNSTLFFFTTSIFLSLMIKVSGQLLTFIFQYWFLNIECIKFYYPSKSVCPWKPNKIYLNSEVYIDMLYCKDAMMNLRGSINVFLSTKYFAKFCINTLTPRLRLCFLCPFQIAVSTF